MSNNELDRLRAENTALRAALLDFLAFDGRNGVYDADVLGTWVDSLMAKLNRLARLEPLVAAIVAAATTPPPGYEDDGAPGGLWHGHKALDDAVEALVRAERGAP